MSIPYHFRYSVIEDKTLVLAKLIARDGRNCCWCGVVCDPLNDGPLKATVEHVVRRADGGSDEMDNLKVACSKCNSSRHSRRWCDRTFQIVKTPPPPPKIKPPKPAKVKPFSGWPKSIKTEVLVNPITPECRKYVYRNVRDSGTIIFAAIAKSILDADKALKARLDVDVFGQPWVSCRIEPVLPA